MMLAVSQRMVDCVNTPMRLFHLFNDSRHCTVNLKFRIQTEAKVLKVINNLQVSHGGRREDRVDVELRDSRLAAGFLSRGFMESHDLGLPSISFVGWNLSLHLGF